MGFLKNNEKTNLYNDDLLYQIYKELNQIIDYINTKFENVENSEIDSDFENNHNNNEIKLGIKRKNSINLEENNEINLKKDKEKNENKRILLEKIKKFKKYSIEIIKKFKDIIIKINNEKKSIFEELEMNNKQKLENKEGTYIGHIIFGRIEGKGIMYYNDGSIYEGDWINDNREGKGTMHSNDGSRYEG